VDIQQELEELRATVREMKDRQEILACIQRECRGRDRQDVDIVNSCWWEDGVDEHGPVITAAPKYAERANQGHAMFFNMTSHNITNHFCTIEGNTAYCESYVVGGLFWKDNKTTTLALGRYIDQLEKRNGEWRLLVRRCTIEMTADCDASWVFSDNVKGFLKGLWSREDPSYVRPIVASREGVRWNGRED